MSARMEFDNELEQLHADLVRMGAMVEQSIEKSISALRTENRELAEMIIHGDHAVDSMEKTIETRCLKLLLRQQPVARDLRSISTALKNGTHMIRIDDHTVEIADISMHLHSSDVAMIASHLEEMAKEAIDMVHASIMPLSVPIWSWPVRPSSRMILWMHCLSRCGTISLREFVPTLPRPERPSM